MSNATRNWMQTEAKRLRKEAADLERKDASFYATMIRLNRTYAERMEAELAEVA